MVTGKCVDAVGVAVQMCGGDRGELPVAGTRRQRRRPHQQTRRGRIDERSGNEQDRLVAGSGPVGDPCSRLLVTADELANE
jgi:hypothetical protein